MYRPASQYGGVPPGGGGGQYRGSPVNVGVPYPPQMQPGFPQQQQQQQPMSRPMPGAPQMRYAPTAPVPYGGGMGGGGGGGAPRPTGRPHKGTLPPGQMVRVGNNTVRVERYLSEGGYAHVYLTTSERPIYPPKRSSDASKGRWGEKGFSNHCLKRIAFDDDGVWADVSKEIEVMKALPPSPHLIQYLDSSHHRLPNGTHEVFILMEVCSGGGIIDLLNKRLRDRLQEIEILNIFTDVCEAVAAMHALSRPLLHRDLKIENVLSHPNGLPPTPQRPTPLVYKLCDFGSTTFPSTRPPSTKAEADALAMDLNKHTTLQYRSPEMVEPMLGWAVGLPSDVWALGVLLYKLCYYTTPFEEHGTLAIVNAKYTFPQYPVYSPRLQHLIASMLVEHPLRRPTVFEVLKTAHEMSGTRPEVDYPTQRSQPMPSALPSTPSKSMSKGNMLDFTESSSASSMKSPAPRDSPMPEIQPQRRGRVTRDSLKGPSSPAPQPVPAPMPHSTSGPSATKLQLTGENKGGANLRYSASIGGQSRNRQSGAGSKFAPSRLDMSAGRPSEQSRQRFTPSPQGSVDAFGVPKGPSPSSATSSATVDAFGVSKGSSPSSATSATPVDAFGVPKPNRGFTDAFGAQPRRPSSSASSGFGDAFGKQPLVKSPLSTTATDNFAQSFSGVRPPDPKLPQGARSVSGFSDTFNGGPASTEPSKAGRQQRSSSSSHKDRRSTSSSSGQSSKTERQSPPTSGGPSKQTFEQRYPSIDELHSGDGKAASPPVVKKAPTPPPKDQSKHHFRRASMVKVNRTGDGKAANRLSVVDQHQPQPRSTHVTGTAFKGEPLKSPVAREDSPASVSATADYLSMLDDEVEKEAHKPMQEDLLGDDDGLKVQLAPLRPTLSNQSGGDSAKPSKKPAEVKPKPDSLRSEHPPSQATSKHQQSARPQSVMITKPQGAAERATLPPISASRPTTNFNSDSWSPLESMRSPGLPKSPSPAIKEPASSDDEIEAPESADAWHAPRSPQFRDYQSPSSPATSNKSASPTKPYFGTNARPQSMFDDTRRRSINDLVGKYEQLSTKEAAKENGRKKPPSVAKPAALQSKAKVEEPIKSPNLAPKPKPAALKPSAPAKPATLRTKPDSPISPVSPVAAKSQSPERPKSSSRSRSSSPEKQQPVNLLIQRWNRGS